jgi:chromosome segregation ATPase
VLEKIWQTYVNLFNRVLHEMQASLKSEQEKTTTIHEVLLKTRKELEGLKKSHPDQMQNVIANLEEQFTLQQSKVEEELVECEAENHRLKQELRTVHGELELWYPSFSLYQDSYLKNHIPHYSKMGGHHSRHAEGDKVSPEVAVAEDFKRLLAVLAPEKRQAIGKELMYVLKTASISTKPEKPKRKGSKTRLSQIVAEGQRQAEEEAKLAALQEEVHQQEKEIKDLKETVQMLEREENENSHLAGVTKVTADGQDRDGNVLTQRRATAVPVDIGTVPLGVRHRPNKLQLPSG